MSFDAVNFSSKQNYADLASPLSLFFYSHFLERAHTLAYCEGQEALKSWRSFRLQQAVAIPPRYRSKFFVQGCHETRYLCITIHVIVRPTKMINNLLKDCKILIFKVVLSALKISRIFFFIFFLKSYRLLLMK